MGRITFEVSYDFLLGLMHLPPGTVIIDARRGEKPKMIAVEATIPGDVEGHVEPTYQRAELPFLFFQEFKRLNRNGST